MESKSYPYTMSVEVSFRDIDSMGHVNNAVYMTYMETARVKYLHELVQRAGINELGMVVAEAHVTYKSPALWGEQLTVGLGISRFGSKSFDYVYRIDSQNDGRLVVEGKTIQVAYDYTAAQPVTVPDAFKQATLDYQKAWCWHT